jgi:glycosyltransferase involved in cell wall biosynthesis
LRSYDLLAVPSQGLETGPLVVLEAFAAGVPVIGSRLGSIAEIVRDEVDGVLVPNATAEGWAHALRRFSEDRGLIERLRTAVHPPRTMSTVAKEMATLYRQTLENRGDYRFSTTASTP